ncbi:GNAT family N-acetyltransferase [Bacillus sp. JCM 19041]|uniref:GNAT family N-acetyltransferase n=1 Tax=Bacillus sp. JCM 19041 TaxID=1460637 RepID=UPI0006D2774D
MNIRTYTASDESSLFALLSSEGDEWKDYLTDDGATKFKRTLERSLTFVAYEGETLCGYSRSVVDGEFHIYVCDLLVHKQSRGKGIGKQLMECIYEDYPEHTVFVLSDVDDYYQKLGYEKEGTCSR